MALVRRGKDEPRQLNRPAAKDYKAREAALIKAVAGVATYSISRGTPVYVGLPSTTGLIKVKFYHEDGAAEGHFGAGHFCREGITAALADLFGEEVSVDDINKIAPWFAEAAAEASREFDTSHAAVVPVEVPQRPGK